MISFLLCFFVVLSFVLSIYAFMDQRKIRRYRRQRNCLHKHFNICAEKHFPFWALPKELVQVLDEIERK